MSSRRKNLARYQQVLKFRDVSGLTFDQIGEKLNISRQRAWEIYQRAIKLSSKNEVTRVLRLTRQDINAITA